MATVTTPESSIRLEDGVVVTFDPLMQMTCDCGQSPWCTHRERVIGEGLDAEALVSCLDQDDVVSFVVPITPSVNCFVSAIAATLSTDAWGVYINMASMELSDPVGIIYRGEGLNVARQILYEAALQEWHYSSKVRNIQPRCRAQMHGLTNQRAVELAFRDRESPEYVANKVLLALHGRCLNCWRPVWGTDADDFVPEF